MSEEQVILVNEQDAADRDDRKNGSPPESPFTQGFQRFYIQCKGRDAVAAAGSGEISQSGFMDQYLLLVIRVREKPLKRLRGRRLKEEMGFETALKKIFDFIYRTEFENGLTEFEFDHVYTGTYNGAGLNPDKQEVKDYCFRSMEDIAQDLDSCPEKYSSWFRIAFPKVKERLKA